MGLKNSGFRDTYHLINDKLDNFHPDVVCASIQHRKLFNILLGDVAKNYPKIFCFETQLSKPLEGYDDLKKDYQISIISLGKNLGLNNL